LKTPILHKDLIEACKNGERKAQFRLYELYYKAMYNTSLRIVKDSTEAEDVMQQSFLDAFRKMNSFRAESEFGPWLKRIVINNSLNALRKKSNLSFIEEYDTELPDNEAADEDFSCQIRELKIAIGELPDDYRIILSLFLFEGYDHEEIGQILNISNNTSRIRFFRAKRKLLDIIRGKRFSHIFQQN